jgi:hypothetical protein
MNEYRVNFWGSHPDKENDDCWFGESYATLAEARAAFESDPYALLLSWRAAHIERMLTEVTAHGGEHAANHLREILMAEIAAELANTAYLEIDGPDVNEVRANPDFEPRKRARDDRDWQREQAMEEGMLHGIDAYNDVMEG